MTCQMVYHNGNCLNTKKPFAYPCKLCIESCPHQAITEYRQLEAKYCTECGVCMAVCPSDGFVDNMIDKLHDYLLETEEIVLNCPQAIQQGFEIPCIGMLDRDSWISLMLLGKEKSATIITGNCTECADREACAAGVQVFKVVHSEWPEHPPIRIQVRPDDGGKVETKPILSSGANSVSNTKVTSGREMISDWRQKSWQKVEEWLPGLTGEETYSIPKSRRFFLEVLRKTQAENVPFPALSVQDSCTDCGVCVSICPQGALQKREEMDPNPQDPGKEDKIKSLRLIWEPQKCVQCGRCREICQPKALSISTKRLSERLLTGKILIHEGSPRYCTQCGKRIFNNEELCLVCSTSDLCRQS